MFKTKTEVGNLLFYVSKKGGYSYRASTLSTVLR